jgi:F0F1-type ATP synthase assembly protein I
MMSTTVPSRIKASFTGGNFSGLLIGFFLIRYFDDAPFAEWTRGVW